ncbi:MAG: hypothetical protein GY870_10100 [archaeon]|nr:hypothetical protein [archaeon]
MIKLISKGKKIGNYKNTKIDAVKKAASFLIEYSNGGSFTIKFKSEIELAGRGIKERYNNFTYEVTSNRLEKLKNEFTWSTNF